MRICRPKRAKGKMGSKASRGRKGRVLTLFKDKKIRRRLRGNL